MKKITLSNQLIKNFKFFMLLIVKSLLFIGLITFLVASIYSYFFQTSQITSILQYFNSIASIIIVVLTIAYVYTTNRQLGAMKEQILLMEKTVNLQVQPLLVPTLKKAYLEKLRAHSGPDDKFTTIQILYRFHHEIELKNVGTGAALNIVAYSRFKLSDGTDFPCYLSRDQVHCLASDGIDKAEISTLGLDKEFKILKALIDRKLVLQCDIFYKNVFGAGFHEKVVNKFSLDEENGKISKKWLTFFEKEIQKYEKDRMRYHALKEKLPEDSKKILDSINVELKNDYTNDLNLEHRLSKESFEVTIVDYNKEIDKMDEEQRDQYTVYAKAIRTKF